MKQRIRASRTRTCTRPRRYSMSMTIIIVSICWSMSLMEVWNWNSSDHGSSPSSLTSSSSSSSSWFHPALFASAAYVRVPETVEEKKRKDAQNSSPEAKTTLPLNQILLKASRRGLGGGIPGAIAGVVQVLTLMWLRTIINYQSRYGTSFIKAVGILYRDGGIGRFYQGLSFALVQAPISRFVSTAANDGVISLLANLQRTQLWGPGKTTVVASFVVGFWRMLLMPLDTCKTVLQVDSVEGFRNLMRRVKGGKIGVLYQGAIANAFSSILGHYPWFFTFNTLSKSDWLIARLPSPLFRNAGIGLFASIISDTIVNSIRVIKTTKQSIATKHDLTYTETIKMILAADGWKGLFGRGLRARILANALQSIVFTVIWRGLADRWGNRETRRRLPEATASEEEERQQKLEKEAEREHLIVS